MNNDFLGTFSQKGVGPSRPAPVEVTAQDNVHSSEAKRLGRRLQVVAGRYDSIVTNSFGIGSRYTIWDITYEIFQNTMRELIRQVENEVENQLDKILLVFAGCLHLSEALREVGNDGQQNKYARYVGKFIVDEGLMPWVEAQGGWVSHATDLCVFMCYSHVLMS